MIPSSPEGAADEPLSARRTTISSWTRSSRSTTTRTSSPESSLSVARSRITTKCRTALPVGKPQGVVVPAGAMAAAHCRPRGASWSCRCSSAQMVCATGKHERAILLEGLSKGLREGLLCDEALATGSPCKCTPLSPACYPTTPSPRCDSMRWSGSPWGWLSISRGNPGPEVSPVEVDVERRGRRQKARTTTAMTKAEDTGLCFGRGTCVYNVATAMDRCLACAGGAGDRRGECPR